MEQERMAHAQFLMINDVWVEVCGAELDAELLFFFVLDSKLLSTARYSVVSMKNQYRFLKR
jgi:hypothetical protein